MEPEPNITVTQDVAEQLREVYAAYGLAVYQAQCAERQLALLLATRYGPNVQRTMKEQQDQLLEELFQQTFGGLIATLREAVPVPRSVETRLRNAKLRRNWLIHNYYWERVGHLLSPQGRESMVRELREMADEFVELHQHLVGIALNWAEENGITEEDVLSEMEQLAQSAELPDPAPSE